MSASSSGADSPRMPLIAGALAVAHAGLIWWLSSQSLKGVVPGGATWGFLGNSFHYVLFGVLAVLVAEAFRKDGGLTQLRLFAVLLIVLLYGVVDEYHQSFTPNRSCDAADVVVDVLGAVGCVSFWWGVRGPGRFRAGVLRLLALGAVAIVFNILRENGLRLAS